MPADALSSFDPAVPHYPEVDRTIIAAAMEFARGHVHWGAQPRSRAIRLRDPRRDGRDGGNQWALSPGCALWLPPGVVHDGATLGAVSRTPVLMSPPSLNTQKTTSSEWATSSNVCAGRAAL
jgi:hypothetical protein